MKKLFKILLFAIICCVIVFSVSCKKEDNTSKQITLSETQYTYSVGQTSGVTVIMNLNGLLVKGLTENETTVKGENYSVSGSLLILSKNYLDTLTVGEHVYKILFEGGSVSFTVTVKSGSAGVGIDDLLGRDYFYTELGSGNGNDKLTSESELTDENDLKKYYAFKRANKALEAGESFTVNYGTEDFWSMRLRPYNVGSNNAAPYPSSFGPTVKTAFKYVTDGEKTYLSVKSMGEGYPNNATGLILKGSSFVNGASYSVEITYEVKGSSVYTLQFGNGLKIASLDGSGVKTKSGSFTVPENLMIKGDHLWYYDLLKIAISGNTDSEIALYQIKLTRTN